MLLMGLDVGQVGVAFDQPTPLWRTGETIKRRCGVGYELVDSWALNCLVARRDLIESA